MGSMGMMVPAPPPPPPPGGVAGGGEFGGPGPASGVPPNMSEGAPSLFTAIQQLGLKLEPKKAPVELIVIDSAQKTPTEN